MSHTIAPIILIPAILSLLPPTASILDYGPLSKVPPGLGWISMWWVMGAYMFASLSLATLALHPEALPETSTEVAVRNIMVSSTLIGLAFALVIDIFTDRYLGKPIAGEVEA